MAISFSKIPNNMRVPLFYAEFDNSQASYFSVNQPGLIVGQMLPDATAATGKPVLVASADQAASLFGVGSMLHHMMIAWRRNDDMGEVWALPVADPTGGAAATATITIANSATANGTLPIYVGGRKVGVGVVTGDAAADVAAALAGAINADTFRYANAVAADGVVTLTARHTGAVCNGLAVEVAPLGVLGDEAVPSGLTVTAENFAGGAGTPDLPLAFAALGDDLYDFIAMPYTDTASLDAVEELLNDTTGRWSYAKQLYGHAFCARVDTLGALSAYGNARNNPFVSTLGLRETPTPVWEIAAAFAAMAGASLRIDPARPLQTLPLLGVTVRKDAASFVMTERLTLLFDGIATATVGDDGSVRIEREITMYRENAFGQPDPSYLDVNTPETLKTFQRRMRHRVESKFSRHKLANDGTRFGAGQAIVTPDIVRAEYIAEYREMERDGLVENMEAFKANLVVERNANDPNRVDTILPPDFVNQLRILAVLTQFRLQY